jgi:glutathione-regulated potassium-efflux system ancillary protein KefG
MNILILFAHPALHKSSTNKRLIEGLDSLDGVTFHDLYEFYPEYDIDIRQEQKLLTEHDCIIFHHPMYWYNMPAILKEWMDLVLTHGWAYGSKGTALKGKIFFNVMTTGGPRQAFQVEGMHQHTLRELIVPIELTVRRCSMEFLPPLVVHGTYAMENEEILVYRDFYRSLLGHIADNKFNVKKALKLEYMNDYPLMEDK